MVAHLNQTFNSFLDIQRIGREPGGQLPRYFVDKVIMGHMFPILHYPNNASLKRSLLAFKRTCSQLANLGLMSPLLVDSILRLFPLLAAFYLGRDCTDLDLLKGRRKVCIKRERVGWINFTSRRMLLQNFEFRARERLKLAS